MNKLNNSDINYILGFCVAICCSILIKKKIYFIFFSSEYIFNGNNGKYSEKSKPNPNLLYGKQKKNIEKYLSKKK